MINFAPRLVESIEKFLYLLEGWQIAKDPGAFDSARKSSQSRGGGNLRDVASLNAANCIALRKCISEFFEIRKYSAAPPAPPIPSLQSLTILDLG
jgi:hypothetical protein